MIRIGDQGLQYKMYNLKCWWYQLGEMDATTHHKVVCDTKYQLKKITCFHAINDIVCRELGRKSAKQPEKNQEIGVKERTGIQFNIKKKEIK